MLVRNKPGQKRTAAGKIQSKGSLKLCIYLCVCIHIQIDKKFKLLYVNTIRRNLRNVENLTNGKNYKQKN